MISNKIIIERIIELLNMSIAETIIFDEIKALIRLLEIRRCV